MGINAYDRVSAIVTTIAKDPKEISQMAQDIFDEALPETVRDQLNKERALQSLQKGIVAGFHQIASKDKHVLRAQYTCPATSSRDTVDLEAHEQMLAAIQKSFTESQ